MTDEKNPEAPRVNPFVTPENPPFSSPFVAPEHPPFGRHDDVQVTPTTPPPALTTPPPPLTTPAPPLATTPPPPTTPAPPTKAEAKAEKAAAHDKAEAKAERAADRKLAKERREHPNPVLDAYDAQIAAADSDGCRVIRIELSAAQWHEFNANAGVKDDKDTYEGIPFEIVGDAAIPTVIGVTEETNLRRSFQVSIRGIVDPLSRRD